MPLRHTADARAPLVILCLFLLNSSLLFLSLWPREVADDANAGREC